MSYEALLSVQQNRLSLFTARHGELGSARSADRDRLDTLHNMQKVQVHDEDTLGSGSGSGISDISALENETDTLGRAIMQHERDARRLRDVLDADQPPLLKTRTRPQVADLMARQDRQEVLPSGRHQDRVGSSGSNDSEPPLNVPREWGIRARSHRGWMRKIREPSEADIQRPGEEETVKDEPQLDEDAIAPHRTAYSGDDYWSPPSRDREPGPEDTPPSMVRPRTSSQPSSSRHMNTTLRHIMDGEDQDFSELSLLASTPAVARTRKTLGSIARREVEQIEEKEKVDRGLQQLSARLASNRLQRRRSREEVAVDSIAATATEAHEPRPVTAPPAGTRPRVAHRRSLIGNKENVPLKGTTGSQYKGSETVTITDRTAQAVTFKQPQRPGHNRNDSMKLLQRLARVSSMSPSPRGSSSDGPNGRTEKVSANQRPKTSHGEPSAESSRYRKGIYRTEDMHIVYGSHAQSSDSRRRQYTEAAATGTTDDQRRDDPPAVVDEPDEPRRNDQRDTRSSSADGGQDYNSAQPTDLRPLLRATDSTFLRAFGTPSGEAALESPNPHDSRPAKDATGNGTANRPRSALEDIMLEAQNNSNGPFGDATIQSLDDIAHPNLDATDTTLTLDASANAATGESDIVKLDKPVTQAEKERRDEDLAIEAMNRHLRAARTSIKDADRGLRRVENRVDNTATEPAEPAIVKPSEAPKPARVTSTVSAWRTDCEYCGGSYRSVWRALWAELRSNFYNYDRKARFGIRFTWLGILVLVWFLWSVCEKSLCSYYCHPEYADSMIDFGVDPDAPEYPFVIPTLIFRPFRPFWRPVVGWIEALYTTIFNLVFGAPMPEPEPKWMQPDFDWSQVINWKALPGYDPARDSYAKGASWETKWAGGIASSTVAAAARVTRSFVDAVDEIGLMEDDEFLT